MYTPKTFFRNSWWQFNLYTYPQTLILQVKNHHVFSSLWFQVIFHRVVFQSTLGMLTKYPCIFDMHDKILVHYLECDSLYTYDEFVSMTNLCIYFLQFRREKHTSNEWLCNSSTARLDMRDTLYFTCQTRTRSAWHTALFNNSTKGWVQQEVNSKISKYVVLLALNVLLHCSEVL